MKAAIIKMLAYPRSLVQRNMELDNCEHYGQFSEADPQCQNCEFEPECRWLCHNDEFVALGEKSAAELKGALSFALSYVDAQIAQWGHRRANCLCEACTWLRKAEQVYTETTRAG